MNSVEARKESMKDFNPIYTATDTSTPSYSLSVKSVESAAQDGCGISSLSLFTC